MPQNRVVFGAKGLKWVKWLGEIRDFRGEVTGVLYAFPEHHRTKGVDLRDLPAMVKDGGRENWEDIEGKKLDEPAPEKPATKPPEKPPEKPAAKPPAKPEMKEPPGEPAPVLDEEVVDG